MDHEGKKAFQITFEPHRLVLGRNLAVHKGVSQYTQLNQMLPSGEVKSLAPRIYTTTVKEGNAALKGPKEHTWKDCVLSDITEDDAGIGFGLLIARTLG